MAKDKKITVGDIIGSAFKRGLKAVTPLLPKLERRGRSILNIQKPTGKELRKMQPLFPGSTLSAKKKRPLVPKMVEPVRKTRPAQKPVVSPVKTRAPSRRSIAPTRKPPRPTERRSPASRELQRKAAQGVMDPSRKIMR